MENRRQSEFRTRPSTENELSFDQLLLSQKIKDRLRQFVENSDEFRSSLIVLSDDAAGEHLKQEIIDQIRSSENFQLFKAEILRSEIDSVSVTTAATPQRPQTFSSIHHDQSFSSYFMENFGFPQQTSTLPSFGSQNVDEDDDEDRQQPLNSGVSFALTGSMSASTFAFMGKNYLKHVVDVLTTPSISDRLTEEEFVLKFETLRALNQLPASDICESEHWTDFKTALRKSLDNGIDDEKRNRLCDAVLEFLIKLFNSSNHNVTVDAFILLADHLKEDIFVEKHRFSIKDGRRFEMEKNRDSYILQKLRIFNEMCSGFVKVLPRYSSQLLRSVAEKMIGFLEYDSTKIEDDKDLTPFLAWSILDPRMKWFRNWMHARLGRTAILSALENRWSIVEFLMETAFDGDRRRIENLLLPSNILQIRSANFMLENLLFYRESRRLFCQRINNFPDDLLNRLLKNAVEGGPKNKSAWKIYFLLTSSTYGRSLFFNERCLRRIGIELLNTNRKYDVKIKLLNFIAELLKSDDESMKTTCDILRLTFDDRDGPTTFGRLIMKAIEESIIAAYSRDPDAPLSVVYACFDTCRILCRTNSGRRLVSQYENFLIYSIKLVKEHSVEIDLLLPILASISSQEAAIKKFLCSNSIRESNFEYFSPVLWYRAIEINEGTIRIFANRLNDLYSKISQSNDLDEGNRYFNLFLRQLFPVLCHPDGCKYLLNHEQFMQILLATLRRDEFDETASIEILLNVLNFVLSRADFLIGLRRRDDIIQEITEILTRYYSIDLFEENENTDETNENSAHSKFWSQTILSTKLMEIYSKLIYLGGPGERLMSVIDEGDLTILNEILHDSSKCFSSEPSRFIVRPVTTGSMASLERSDGESLLNFFLSCIERKKRIPYSEILLESVKDLQNNNFEEKATDFSTTEASKDYQILLDYGKNLNILNLEIASNDFPIFIQKISHLKNLIDPDLEVDWFAAIVYLIFGGQHKKSIEFLQKFSNNETIDLKCLWSKMSLGSDYVNLINSEIVNLVDTILENELPRVVATLTMHGLTPSNLVVFWLNQCFINILDWPEICNYLILAVIGGRKYQAFFCCCLFKQVAEEIYMRTHNQKDNCDLHSFLIEPISFKFYKCLTFLAHLSDKYL